VRPFPVTIGRVELSPLRRLTAVVRSVLGEPAPVVDIALEISDGQRWCGTRNQVRIEVDKVGELVDVLQRALRA
jgi:hypothetical protein